MGFVRATVTGLVLLMLAGCHRELRRGSPGVNCSIASCCYGWYWNGFSCQPLLGPSNCGCRCQIPPEPYGGKEECLSDHPGASVAETPVAAATGKGGATASRSAGKRLVIAGTVEQITMVDDGFKRWAIAVHVEKVVTGQLLGDRLTFLVHSPARAGLTVGHTYTVEAVWEDSGYSVDELQWFRRGEMTQP